MRSILNFFGFNKSEEPEEPRRRLSNVYIRISPWSHHIDKHKLLKLIEMYRNNATEYYNILMDGNSKNLNNYAKGQLDAWELFYTIVKNNKIN